MKKIHTLNLFLFYIIFLFPLLLFAQSSSIEYAIFNEEGLNSFSPLDIDEEGNVYRIVPCTMKTDYHDEQGSKSIQPNPTTFETSCLQKIDNKGNLVWSKGFIANSSGPSMFSYLKIQNGFIYLSGSFEGLIDFELDSTHVVYPTTYGWKDIFVAKYDLSGALIWVKSIGTLDKERADSPLVDKDGNVIFSVELLQPTDLDPGPNQVIRGEGLHLVKFSSDGNFLWSREIEYYKDLELFPNGHILFYSNFYLASDNYLLELDQQGNVVQQILCKSKFQDLAIDNTGNIYAVGASSQNSDLDLGPNFYSLNVSSSYTFLLKMNRAFNLIWAKEIDSSPNSLAVDHSQNIVIAGTWVHNDDFDPGSGKVERHAFTMNGHGFYLLQLDHQGNFIDVTSIENSVSSVYNFVPTIIVNSLDAIYFYSTIGKSNSYFNLVENYIPNVINQNFYSSFLLKINNPNYLNFVKGEVEIIKIFPNPSAQKITISTFLWVEAQVKIFDMTGRLIYETYLKDNLLTVDISDYERGTYVVHLIHGKDCVSKKIIKI